MKIYKIGICLVLFFVSYIITEYCFQQKPKELRSPEYYAELMAVQNEKNKQYPNIAIDMSYISDKCVGKINTKKLIPVKTSKKYQTIKYAIQY